MNTASTMIAPIRICCQNELTSFRLRPFLDQPHDQHATEDTEHTVRGRRKKLAPPMMTAAIASSSMPRPAFGNPEFVRPAMISPAMPAMNPQIE